MASTVARFGIMAILWALMVDAVRQDMFKIDGNINTQGAFDGVTSFSQKAKRFGSAGSVAGQLVMNIESGVKGTVSQSDFDDNSDVLKLHVVHSQTNEGEIATPSKVPILWKLEKETTYTLQKDGNNIKISVQGLTQRPFSEGLEMYKSSGVMEACAQKTDLLEKVKCERHKLFKYFEKNWNTFKKETYLSEPNHKIGRIMKGIYGSTATYYAVKSTDGIDGWEKILYAFVMIPPQKINYFLLFPDPKGNEDDVEVGSVLLDPEEDEYVKFDFFAKIKAEADPEGFEKNRGMAERFARSSMNFAAMGTKGRLFTENGVDIKGGTAKYILKFASPCIPKEKKYKYNDATDNCRDDNGRLYWH